MPIQIDDTFLWKAILDNLPSKHKKSGTNFENINCPACIHRGESQDKRRRCGIKYDAKGLGIYCFNCGFKALWSPGKTLSKKIKEFLSWYGLGELEINRLNHKAYQLSKFNSTDLEQISSFYYPNFKVINLPKEAQPLSYWADDPSDDYINVLEYLSSRGEEVLDHEYYWCPSTEHNFNKRIIIPFYWYDRIVGYTARAIDNNILPRYFNNTQPHYLFNNHVMYTDREYIIIVEGIFDAIAIDGVSTQGAKLNEQQALWIKSIGKKVIVVPDHDKAGTKLIDQALINNWYVSFPRIGTTTVWDNDIKDVADAVKRYGRLYTLRTILDNITDNKIKINHYKNKLLKEIK